MATRVLFVFSQPELGEMLKERFEVAVEDDLASSGRELIVDVTRNESAALMRMRDSTYSLLVTEADIPADKRSLRNASELLGFRLAQSAHRSGIAVALLGVTSVTGFEEKRKAHPGYFIIAQEAPGWEQLLISYARQALGTLSTPAEGPSGRAEIVMNLAQNVWSYSLQGCDSVQFNRTGTLQIDRDVIEEIRELSELVADATDKWESHLRRAGEKLMVQLFENNWSFSVEFFELVGLVHGQENVRIQFVVEKSAHGLALEALYDTAHLYWMLRTPIVRRLNVGSGTFPLFAGNLSRSEPLNCLIICADAYGPVPNLRTKKGGHVLLEKLSNITKETSDLESLLKELRERANVFNIGKIEVIKEPKAGRTFWQTVLDVAQVGTWSIVHYAGHSYHDDTRGGMVFFPGQEFPEAISVGTFSQALGRPRFVYLSSCKSSHASFAFELASQNAGSIVGFRWDLDDLKAAEFSNLFYKSLFTRKDTQKSLEYAFLAARREMHGVDSSNKIWAAPILMMA